MYICIYFYPEYIYRSRVASHWSLYQCKTDCGHFLFNLHRKPWLPVATFFLYAFSAFDHFLFSCLLRYGQNIWSFWSRICLLYDKEIVNRPRQKTLANKIKAKNLAKYCFEVIYLNRFSANDSQSYAIVWSSLLKPETEWVWLKVICEQITKRSTFNCLWNPFWWEDLTTEWYSINTMAIILEDIKHCIVNTQFKQQKM